MDPIIGGALIGGGASLLGGFLGGAGADQASQRNQASAREQMAFQADQSGTAYQRAVKDMRLAGLNPMLAYSQGGASSPSGASASAVAPDYSQAASGLASSAKDAINQKREASALTSQQELMQIQGKTAKAQETLNLASAKNAEANAKNAAAELPGIKSETDLNVKRNMIDEKMLYLDAGINRVGQVMGIGNSAKSLGGFNKSPYPPPRGEPGRISTKVPAMKGNPLPKNLKNLDLSVDKRGNLLNRRTGELYD